VESRNGVLKRLKYWEGPGYPTPILDNHELFLTVNMRNSITYDVMEVGLLE
jgi:hypothetical protein